MGTWGHNYFENDAAFDYVAEIEESENLKEVIKNLIESAFENEDYLDADVAEGVIVAAIYVDRQVNGTIYSDPDRDEPLAVDTFPERHPQVDLSPYRTRALQALNKVVAEDSELLELWSENEELMLAWKKNVEDLSARLL